MPNRQQIVDSIVAVARKLGRTPSMLEFVAGAEISRHSLLRVFRKWNEAVRAAGLPPLRLYVRRKDRELLEDWGEVARKKRTVPSKRSYLINGKYVPRTLENRFGGWSALPRVFRKFAKGKREWADVLALLPVAKPPLPKSKETSPAKAAIENLPSSSTPHNVLHVPFPDRPAYGNSIDFRGLLHEPVNEQGVVFVFGMVAQELGYRVEAVQTGFPDCEAMRQISPGRWQRVRIEFEFESRNFRDHGHPPDGCDIVVCWRHNWPDCPPHLEVLELSSVIRSLTRAEAS